MRLRGQADVEGLAVRTCLQQGAVLPGLRHSTRHEKIVRKLMRRDPDAFHDFVLVGLFYNRAALLDALGAGPAAIAAAREAVDRYEGASATAAVHRYGTMAVAAYEALKREGAVGADDVARVRRQYDTAREHLK